MSLISEAEPASQLHSTQRVACNHCGLTVPSGLVVSGAELQFCCAGCRAVYEAINAHGLERYYQLQQGDPGKPSPARPTGRAYAELDDREFLDAHAPLIAPGLRSTELYLEGIHCSACVWLVEKLPRVAPGVIESRLDMRRALVKVVWEENKSNLPSIARTLDSLGYTPHAGRDSSSRNLRQREDRNLLVRIAIAGAGAGNVMLLAFALYGGSFHGMEHEYSSLFRWMSMGIGLIVLLWPGSLFFRGAWAALRTRTAHLDLPIAIGLGAGTVAGTVNTLLDRGEIYFDSLTSLVFLLLVGRYIQRRLERRAADTVELLFSLTPSFARLREGAECRDVPIEALKLEQIIEVRPGESFPADGDVVEGDSSVDLSLLTGESHPVPVCPGERIFAGSVNVDRILLARISALGKDTRVGKLLILMEECAQRKAPIVRLADRMAGYFTLGAIVLFAATLIGWHFVDPKRAVDNALSLLIVTCPCGLGLATPFAVAVALGRAARASILVKGGDVLEKLAASCRAGGTVFLDKTGTLTEPGLAVVAWHGDDTIRDQVAALEAQVSHPIARAIAGVVERRTVESGQAVLSKASPRGIEGQTDGMHFKIGSESFVLQSRLDDSSMSSSDPAGPEACLGPAYPVAGPEESSLSSSLDEHRLSLRSADPAGPEACLGPAYPVAGPEESSLSPSLDGHRLDLQSIAPDWAIAARREMTSKCLTPVWVSVNGSVAAVIGVGSRLRDDATKTIQDLREMGHKVQILSGDDPDTVGSLGRQLGMASQDCRGGLSPEDKLHIIEAATAPAFMVGDGVNDAAALSAASVGIAVHGGAEASLAAADVYLGRPGVAVLIELFEGSRRTLNVIRRCLRVSLGYNLVAAALATTGLINPLVAAILMPLASFTVLGIALGSRTFAAMESRPELDRLSAVSYQPSAGNSEIHPADS